MRQVSITSSSCERDTVPVVQAVVSSFFTHAARRDTQEGYRTAVDRQPVFLDRTSALQGCIPELVFHELIETSLENTRDAVAVDPTWPLQRLSARRTEML